ncbi:RNA polymerase sigma factor [Liquorilactobacillus ghanensis]|uniref:RNA polymerase sigma factor n=1 Tax=Liquorilactobacillus ghanensis TaxID=399370 RepID=UPI0039E79BA4
MQINEYEQLLIEIIQDLIIYLKKMGATKVEAEDISQDIFIKAWQMELDLPPVQLKAYLKKAAKSRYIDLRRHQQRTKIIINRFGPSLLKEIDELFYLDKVKIDERKLFDILERLTFQEQKLILDRYQYQLSIQTIAEQSNLSQAAIKMRLYRIKRKLRKLMKGSLNDG